MHHCITSRNVHVTDRIQQDFEQRIGRICKRGRTSSRSKDDDSVMVFPVSVQAFWAHQNDEEEPPVGFPNIYYTGMPSLEAWISKATAPERQRHARSMLNSLHGLLNSVRTGAGGRGRGRGGGEGAGGGGGGGGGRGN